MGKITDLEKALQSTEMMDAYLELNLTSDIIREIKEYRKSDRTIIATAVMQGMCANPNVYRGQHDKLAREVTMITDALIAELNK